MTYRALIDQLRINEPELISSDLAVRESIDDYASRVEAIGRDRPDNSR